MEEKKKTKTHQISNSMLLFGGDSEVCCRQHEWNQEDLKLCTVLKTGTRNQDSKHTHTHTEVGN